MCAEHPAGSRVAVVRGAVATVLTTAALAGCGGLLSSEPLVNRSRDAGVETLVRVAGASNLEGAAALVLVDGDMGTSTMATQASVMLPVARPVSTVYVRAPDVIDMDILIREASDGRWRRARRFFNCRGGARLKLKGSPTLDAVRVQVLRSTTDVQFRREQWRDAVGAAGAKVARSLLKRENAHDYDRNRARTHGWGVVELEAATEGAVRRPVSYVRARIYEIEVLGPG